ncbi:MAG TPA: ATP-binding protein [Limnobacter sp.]|uniref:sensor histidine kinase n=1 Tax=Limnobacter sp. TaxID=2003368 RepID=UPI002E336F44|nr:ATP-binding protein [Limnobacter sp.]HEX5486937.1 ATP-binding protein [Limnobacter sp.]
MSNTLVRRFRHFRVLYLREWGAAFQRSAFLQTVVFSLALALATACVEFFLLDLSPLTSILLFLVLVVAAAYFASPKVSFFIAVVSFCVVHYLVVEPRYSLHVNDWQSLSVLVSYLLVSMLVNSLVYRLNQKTREAIAAMRQLRQERDDEIRSRLLASFSHDMRTPLTAILAASTALSEQFERLSDADRRALVESIESEAFHLVSSSENILALIALRNLPALPKPLGWQAPQELVEQVVRRYRLRRLKTAIVADCQQDVGLIRADVGSVTQALSNLLDNAFAVHKKPTPIVVEIRQTQEAGRMWVDLAVLDEGPGFPDNFSPRNLKMFEHIRPGYHRGFGLGLPIIQTIMDLHGGQLRCTNRPEGGARVVLRFEAFEPELGEHLV